MKKEIDQLKQATINQINLINFLEKDNKVPFETTVELNGKELVFIGMGDYENWLTKRYNIDSDRTYMIIIEPNQVSLEPCNLGNDNKGFYFVYKKYFDANKNSFIPKKNAPLEDNLRIVKVNDKIFISIGKGIEGGLAKFYDIPLEQVYFIDDTYSNFLDSYNGYLQYREYWVEGSYYLDNIEKFQKKPPVPYKLVTRGDKQFVSIGMGDEQPSLVRKYNIDGGDVYRLDWDEYPYNAGWTGSLRDVEYYVEEEFYKNNIAKFQQ